MGSVNQQGVVLMQRELNRVQTFPKELRRGPFSRFEKKFTLLFGALIFISYTTIGLLAIFMKESTIPTEKEILQIQERYAELVLNQPKPKVEEKPAEKTTLKEDIGTVVQEKKTEEEEVKVDRAKESFTEKEQRKIAGSEERKQIREQVSRQIQSAGIFAAITASAGGVGGGSSMSASDLLGGAANGIEDLSNISLSKGTFASKNTENIDVTARKGTRTADVSIQRENIGRAEVAQVASSAAVNITSAEPEVTGESSSHSDRSQAVIAKVVGREAQRLKRVYEDWLKRDPALSGQLTVKFTILPTGAVSSVIIVKSSTNNQEFDETIIRYIRRWQFPAVPDGSPVEVVYPFVFEGQS